VVDGAQHEAREAELAAVTIGPLEFLNGPVRLHDYNSRWPERFAREEQRIRRALGNGVLRLDHVGSTSVPGLIAKPRIDMLLVVSDPADEATYAPALQAAGYTLRIREPNWHEHRLFNGPETDVNPETPSAPADFGGRQASEFVRLRCGAVLSHDRAGADRRALSRDSNRHKTISGCPMVIIVYALRTDPHPRAAASAASRARQRRRKASTA
jgi:GrpB-like predicted nucleotidyltransferase (UPF0157 family)